MTSSGAARSGAQTSPLSPGGPHEVDVPPRSLRSSPSLSCSGRPAAATTYQMMPDAALADQAAVVVEVGSWAPIRRRSAASPSTDYLVEVNRVLKGDLPGSTVVVRVPGGVDPARGWGCKIWGAPRFAEGEGRSSSSAPPRTAPTASST